MKKKISLLFVILSALTVGCSTLLPSSRVTVDSPWHSYEDATKVFDKIVPGKTTAEELRMLGFDPFSTPNVKVLTYLDVMNRFMPNPSIKKEDLPEGIQRCVAVKTNCNAIAVDPQITKSKRVGSLWLDMFNFRRETDSTGWKFDAIIILIDDIVVYKLSGGIPRISEQKVTRNPLGPLQSIDGLISDATKSAF